MIKGIYKKNIYTGDNGFLIGLLKVLETDDSEVKDSGYKRTVKSVGNSTTTSEDMCSLRDVSATFLTLSSSVASRLRRAGLKGSVVQITVRDIELNIYEKQKILYKDTDNSREIYECAVDLFKECGL